jgi:hypothetical protein
MNFQYVGKTYKNCSPSSAQQGALSALTSLQKTMASSYSQVFGAASSVFNSLSAKLNSIISNPSGLDAATLARINAGTLARSAASENAAQQAVNAKGAATSATPGVESGITQQVRGQVVSNLEGEKNTELNNTAIQNAELGVSERDKAISEEEQLPGVFNSSTSAGNAAVGAAEAEAKQANENASVSGQAMWAGALSGLADSAAGGITKALTGGVLGGGGGGSPSGDNGAPGGAENPYGETDPSSAGILSLSTQPPGWEAPGGAGQ